MFCFNFEPAHGSEYVNPQRYDETRLTVKFDRPLAEAITIICYALFDESLLIDAARNVMFG